MITTSVADHATDDEDADVSEFEDLLLDLERMPAGSGEAMGLPELFELRMAAATAHELMAAIDRGDAPAAGFHSELLEHHVHNAHALRFHLRENTSPPTGVPGHGAVPPASTCTGREPH